jgi:hypothetical protein
MLLPIAENVQVSDTTMLPPALLQVTKNKKHGT